MPFDVIGIIVILGILFGAVLYFGKSAGISLIFSLPISIFLFENFPYTNKFLAFGTSTAQTEWLKITLLVIFSVLTFAIVRRGVSVVFSWTRIGKATEATILSVSITGLIAILLANFIDISIVTKYLPILEKLLSIPNILFWWFVGSMIALYFMLNK